jgi:hypothetical protein
VSRDESSAISIISSIMVIMSNSLAAYTGRKSRDAERAIEKRSPYRAYPPPSKSNAGFRPPRYGSKSVLLFPRRIWRAGR